MTDSPFQVSIAPTEVTMGLDSDFTITITNTGPAATFTGSSSDVIQVQLPVGDDLDDLSTNIDETGITPSDDQNWTGTKREGFYGWEFIIRPRAGARFGQSETASFDIKPVTISTAAAGVSTVKIAGALNAQPVQPPTLDVTKSAATLKVLSFKAQPETVGLGQKTKLTWTVIKAEYVDITPDVGSFKTRSQGMVSDSTWTLPKQQQSKTTYTASARAGSQSVPGEPVTVALAPAEVLSFVRDPDTPINARNAWAKWTEVKLVWNTRYGPQVFLDLVTTRPRVPSQVTANYPYKIEPGKLLSGSDSEVTIKLIAEGYGDPAVKPLVIRFNPATIHYLKFADLAMTKASDLVTGDTDRSLTRTGPDEAPVWTLDVSGPGGPLQQQIGRGSDALQIAYFSASPNPAKPGEAVTLTWITHSQDTLVLDPGGNTVPTKPNFQPVTHEVHPTATTTYVLKATKGSMTITSELTVTVLG